MTFFVFVMEDRPVPRAYSLLSVESTLKKAEYIAKSYAKDHNLRESRMRILKSV